MFFNLFADLVLALHFTFICFVLMGAFLLLKWPRVIYLHIPAIIWGILIEAKGWICPLTPLEQWFRFQAGQSGYKTGFIEHYLLPVIYPSGLTQNIQIVFAIFVFLINLIIYSWLILRHKRPDQNKSK